VAAAATTQVGVAKRVSKGATFAEARILAGDERVDEVARMLSGGVAKDSAVRHARELIDASRAGRR
jgi:DNA repair protein RecN (Recombination protein N)